MKVQNKKKSTTVEATSKQPVFQTQNMSEIEDPVQILQTLFSESIIQELKDKYPKIFYSDKHTQALLKKLALLLIAYVGELMQNIHNIDKYNKECPYSKYIMMHKIQENPVVFYSKLYTKLFDIQSEEGMLRQITQSVILCIDFILLFFQTLFNITDIIIEKTIKIAEILAEKDPVAIREILQNIEQELAILDSLDNIISELIEKLKNSNIDELHNQPLVKQVVYINIDNDNSENIENYITLPLTIEPSHIEKLKENYIKECVAQSVNTTTQQFVA